MGLEWYDEAWEDYLYWQAQDKKTLKRLNNLIKDTQRSPYEGIGKPEPLKMNCPDGGAEELMIVIGLFIKKKMEIL